MNKKLSVITALFFLGASTASFADKTPFDYDYKLDGFVVGLTSNALDQSYGKAICLIAVNKPDLSNSTPDYEHYGYYHYAMAGDGCSTAKLALMTGEKVYLWGAYGEKGGNPEAKAIEIVTGDVKWKLAPKKR